jgi:5-methylthioadenosine/S-adenosylhomocysteine deaminase
MADRIGSLEPGKQADIVCVDVATPRCAPFGAEQPYAAIVHGASSSDVTLTMVAGKVLYDWGDWKTLDPVTVVEDAQREGAALVKRAGIGARS